MTRNSLPAWIRMTEGNTYWLDYVNEHNLKVNRHGVYDSIDNQMLYADYLVEDAHGVTVQRIRHYYAYRYAYRAMDGNELHQPEWVVIDYWVESHEKWAFNELSNLDEGHEWI